uniref:Uncharacterized protein n=1 Tax=Rhizophora mucronata TaxID=61149 RepID=A0A2P2KK34_RHIMU
MGFDLGHGMASRAVLLFQSRFMYQNMVLLAGADSEASTSPLQAGVGKSLLYGESGSVSLSRFSCPGRVKGSFLI